MIPTDPETLIDSWIGECTGSQIKGLFDPARQADAPASLTHGDIALVGRTVAGIAQANHAGNRVLRLLAKYGMNPIHSREVLQEAMQFSASKSVSDSTLVDLGKLPFVTIDNEDSRDLDQALYLMRPDVSSYRVYYALADAAWFVRPGSALHAEAMRRGVTYYAPELAVSLLPAILSENLISLNANVERRALVFQLDLADNGALCETRILRARIKSRAKLSYDGVQAWYDTLSRHQTHAYSNQDWSESLALLREVGELRIADADERDVINFNRREARVIVDPDDPERFAVRVRQRNAVEQYNEQISLLCNTAGAALQDELELLTPELQAVYRVHLPPLALRIQRFKTQLAALIKARGLKSNWQWRSGQTLADYVSQLPQAKEHYAVKQAIERMIMMTNRASSYAADAEIHHALGVDAYARFSSPMREVVGIFTHKEMLEALGIESGHDKTKDSALRSAVIDIANESKKRQSKLEKECQLLAIDSFLAEDLDSPVSKRPSRSATVMGMRANKVYLSLDGFALDLKLYLEDLQLQFNCQYQIGEVSATPSSSGAPSFTIGDSITVRTERWDEARRRYIFSV